MTDDRQTIDNGPAKDSDDVYAGGGGWVWHPAIRALGWVKDWILWAIFAAVLWEAVTVGVRPAVSVDSLIVHVGTICAALVAAVIPIQLLQAWVSLGLRFRRDYPARLSAVLIMVVTAIILVIGYLYALMIRWLFHQLSPLLHWLADSGARIEVSSLPIWLSLAVLAGIALFVLTSSRPTLARKHLHIWQLLGFKRAVRGLGIMVILRLRQPRKDFFLQAPLVRDVPAFAVAAVLHQMIPIEFVSWAVPLLLVAVWSGITVDLLLPPAWVFLGRSHFDSYATFERLRASWRFGVTLLDRDNPEWHKFYFAHRELLLRHGSKAARFMNNPRTPRVWSLRSRGELWESTVQHLMEIAPVVVVDARAKSYYIFDEVLWLGELRLIDKALILGNEDETAPAVDGALAWAERDGVVLPPGTDDALADRIVTEAQLRAATWTASGLEIVRNGAAPLRISGRGAVVPASSAETTS